MTDQAQDTINVYEKKVAGIPTPVSVSPDLLGGMKAYRYDATHAILYRDRRGPYNFTLVTAVSSGPESPTGSSKTFFGDCFIVGMTDDGPTNYEGVLPPFNTTMYIGPTTPAVDFMSIPSESLRGYIKRPECPPYITDVADYIDAIPESNREICLFGDNCIVYDKTATNPNFVAKGQSPDNAIPFNGDVVFCKRNDDGSYGDYQGELKPFVNVLYIN